jgi:NADPH-dependent glutamate synthase beta subunit-like oxidoreductase
MPDLEKLWAAPRHVVAICGGAVSGAEAAAYCASRGLLAIVFEQNARPYGKIEDGLPRWHDKLRTQEYARIDENLAREGVLFVPRTLVGRDIALAELSEQLGLSAVVLANGAWRDRPLPVPGVEPYVGRGLVYQNAFVHWFNHYEEPGYDGPKYQVVDDAIVVGGGLASVDVVKIINLELYRAALAARGKPVSVVELEHQGIPKTLASLGLTAEQLGVRGATLYYRRRIRDMPVATPKDESPEQLAKTEGVREKLVQVLAQKYFVRVAQCEIPVAPIIEGERLVGLRFRRSELQNGKLVELAGSEHDVRAALIVSSIGSVPEPIAGVPSKGELYDYADWSTGQVRGLSNVFGLGNVLTGKGNIKDSRENAREVSEKVLQLYLGATQESSDGWLDGAHERAREAARQVFERATQKPPLPVERVRAIVQRVQARWKQIGYTGDYRAWMAAHAAG